MRKSMDRAGASRLAVAGLAKLVLAFATGLPLRSAATIVPEADDGLGPFCGL